MRKFIITEEEKRDILNLYEQATTQPAKTGQQKPAQATKKSIGVCNGNNPISEPFVKAFDDTQRGNKLFNLTIYFEAAGSQDTDFEKGLTSLRAKIIEKEKVDLNKYDINLYAISYVAGSASNYLNGPLQPTHDNSGKQITSVSPEYSKYPGPKKPNYDNNLKYAESRWGNISNYINSNGARFGFKMASGIKPVKIVSLITDTGGCTDEKRNITEYPNPGQYVMVNGVYKIVEKKIELTLEQKTKMKKCIPKLKILIGYIKQGFGLDGVQIGTNSKQNHQCDVATFTIYCNGVAIGVSNLNNGTIRLAKNKSEVLVGAQSYTNENASIEYVPPERYGGQVYSVFTLTDSAINKIINNSPDGKLKFGIMGTAGTYTRDDQGNQGVINANYHGDAPMVVIYNNDGSGGTIYSGEPWSGAGDIPSGQYKQLVSVDPCSRKA